MQGKKALINNKKANTAKKQNNSEAGIHKTAAQCMYPQRADHRDKQIHICNLARQRDGSEGYK